MYFEQIPHALPIYLPHPPYSPASAISSLFRASTFMTQVENLASTNERKYGICLSETDLNSANNMILLHPLFC